MNDFLKKFNLLNKKMYYYNRKNINLFCKEGSNIFIYIYERKSDEDKIIISDSIKNILEVSSDEIEKNDAKLLAYIHKDDIQKVLENQNEILHNPTKSIYEIIYRVITKSNSIKWIKENAFTEQDKNGDKFIVGICKNITQEKEKFEEMRKTAEELKKADESKNMFINVLAHDLRTPFTSIIGFTEILLNEPNLSFTEREEFLNYILESSQSQLEYINYLLDWSRLKTGNIKIERKRIRISEIIYNALTSLTGSAIRKNINIRTYIKNDAFVYGDERLLNQVIINLVNNAIKFSFENSVIEITTELFNNNEIEIIVKDYGIGLTKENTERIISFENILSLEGTKGEKGTGLGLMLVKEIVEKHNGRIWFFSEIGKGTEFHFTFPTTRKQILIINNLDEERNELKDSFEKTFLDYEISAFSNAFEALPAISEKSPNLIITSDKLPLMSGFQFMESLKNEKNNLKYSVIIISDNVSKQIEQKYKTLGVKAILTKPFLTSDLIGIVKQNLS
ncbi:MAG: hypothetical protein STSR0008_19550 [Ignavibacterium sp.]